MWVTGIGEICQIEQKIQYGGLEKVTSQTAKLGMANFGVSFSAAEHPLPLN